MSICKQCKHYAVNEDISDEDEEVRECNIDEGELLWEKLPAWAASLFADERANPSYFERRDNAKEMVCVTLGVNDCPCFESL
jgi:hypothetical protein